MKGLLPVERSDLLRRERAVRELEHLLSLGREQGHKAHDVTRAYAEGLRSRGMRVSASAMWEWRRRYRADGLAGLMDGRRRRFDRRELERRCPAFLRELARQWNRRHGVDTTFRYAVVFSYEIAYEAARAKRWRPCMLTEAERWLREKLNVPKGRSRGPFQAVVYDRLNGQ
jgi:hypothetical protein